MELSLEEVDVPRSGSGGCPKFVCMYVPYLGYTSMYIWSIEIKGYRLPDTLVTSLKGK